MQFTKPVINRKEVTQKAKLGGNLKNKNIEKAPVNAVVIINEYFLPKNFRSTIIAQIIQLNSSPKLLI